MTWRALGWIIGLMLALSACGGSDPIEATLRADASTGDEVVVTYELDGETVTETVAVPWTLEVELSGSFDVDLTVENPAENGSVFCAIDIGFGSPDAAGEAEAICTLSGTQSGGSLETSSSSVGVPREGPDVLDEESGVSVLTQLADTDGNPTEPGQFEDFVVLLTVEGIPPMGDFTVSVELAYDNGETTRNLDTFERFDADDLDDDGVFRLPLPDNRGYPVTTVGTHVVTVTGSVRIGDEGDALPFSERLSFRVDEADVTIDRMEMAGGLVSLDMPSSWEVVLDQAVERFNEGGQAVPAPPSVADLRELASVRQRGGQADMAVFRITRPKAVESLDAAAAAIREVYFGGDAVIDIDGEPVEVAGLEGVRFAGALENRFTADVLLADTEILLVQTRAPADDDAAWLEATTVRDSLALTPDVIPALAHYRIVDAWFGDDQTTRMTFEVPADWAWDEANQGVISGPGDTFSITVLFIEERTLDQLVDEVAQDFDPDTLAILEGDTDGFPSASVLDVESDPNRAVALIEFPDVVFVAYIEDAASPPDTDRMIALFNGLRYDPIS